MKNLSSFLNPAEIKVTIVIVDVLFCLSTMLLPIVVYMIFRVKSMGKYRWYILNVVVWDYAYDLLLAIMRPVLFFPVMGGYSQVSKRDVIAKKEIDFRTR